ncbi:MAG TPA: hypothetical protein VFN67_37055 [Polyangiales bacterium]|nr:hypothetical protein [Polyangiales bacterium]
MLLLLCAASAVRAAPQDQVGEFEGSNADHHSTGPVNMGVVVGYGIAMLGAGTLTAENPYGTGFGVQLDYQFDTGVVLGFGADYFMGEAKPAGMQAETFARYLLWHARLGYNIRMNALGGRIDLRPSVWFGAAQASVNEQPTFPHGSADAFLLAPGLSFHYLLGDSGWYVGEDIRVSLPIAAHARSAMLILLAFGAHL